MATNETKVFTLPYRSKLTEKIDPGQTLIIKGNTNKDTKRFTVNLHRDTPDFSGNDVPLHISFRFDEKKMVFNSFTKGEWGKEERQKLPFKKGTPFDLRIRAHDNKFTVYCDRKEVKEFDHRVPLQWVTHLSIDGDAQIHHVQWGGKYYPIPYESGIAGEGLYPGKSLLVYGIPEKKAKRFNINLLKKNGDIALHFNPRFDEKIKSSRFICGLNRGRVVRNALINGEWGKEEDEGKMPFKKHTAFDLEIKNEEYAFQVFVNGERWGAFAHRVDPHEIGGLQIQGDLDVTGIQIA